MFQKALVPTDGSAVAEEAIAQVGPLLGPGGAALVVEVVDTIDRILMQTTPAGFDLAPAYVSTEILEDIVGAQRREAEAHLAAARRALEAAGVAGVETRIVEGVPGPELVAIAQAEGCDVVVMATHGRSGLRRAVLGSVADHVLRHLHGIPVLLLHPDGEDVEERDPAGAAVGA